MSTGRHRFYVTSRRIFAVPVQNAVPCRSAVHEESSEHTTPKDEAMMTRISKNDAAVYCFVTEVQQGDPVILCVLEWF